MTHQQGTSLKDAIETMVRAGQELGHIPAHLTITGADIYQHESGKMDVTVHMSEGPDIHLDFTPPSANN